MDKLLIGLIFITLGVIYGSLALDGIYNATLGFLIKNKWIEPPVIPDTAKRLLGRKPTILLYSTLLIIIGIILIWTRNS